MPTDAVPTAAYDLAVIVRDCIAARLATDGLPAPARACVTVGEIAWDECPCGQLAVSLIELFPSETFPTFTLAPTVRCPPKLTVAHYTVELVRCANTGSDISPPTCQALAADALLAVRDAHAVRAGITCCLDQAAAARSIVDYALGRQVMIGPQGGCVGSRTDLYIGLMACGCTPGGG